MADDHARENLMDDDGGALADSAGAPDSSGPTTLQNLSLRHSLELAERNGRSGSWFWDKVSDTSYMTPNARAILGLDMSVDINVVEHLMANIHPDDREYVERRVRSLFDDGQPFDLTCRICDGDGTVRWMHARAGVDASDEGELTTFAGSIDDTTDHVNTLNELQTSELRFRSLIETAAFPIIITRPSDRSLRYVNNIGREILEALDAPEGTFYIPDFVVDVSQYEALRAEILAKGYSDTHEIELRKKDGGSIWYQVRAVLIDYQGDPCAYTIMHDVTERHELEEQLRLQAATDPLTGAANRTELAKQLDFAVASCKRGAPGFALLLLDLDNFKMVNDALGHSVGDNLLNEVARRLTSLVRETDTVARVGGDEFAIVARHMETVRGASILAEKIIASLSVPFELDGVVVNAGCSIGVALHPWNDGDQETLMRYADIALYRAKDDGRGRYALFDEELSRKAHERMELDRDLRVALNEDGLSVAYQPRFDAQTHEPIAAEALARWEHPTRGPVGPDQFIPLAEEAGLIVTLERQVFGKVVDDISMWRSKGVVTGPISVNFSAAHLMSANAVDWVLNLLKERGVPASAVQIEVTESTMIKDEHSARSQTQRLADAGVQILIDDFGTGYSSLAYLNQFRAHKLKIDRSFITNLKEVANATLVKQIVSIGKSLDLRIVAEGVETEAQADFLKAIGCDELQGFLLSRPIPADEFEALMTHQHAQLLRTTPF